MRSASTNGSDPSQLEDALVLSEDEREERRAYRVGLAIEPAVAVLAAIQVVRREDDEAAVGERRAEVVVGRLPAIDRVARQAVAAVLHDDDRPPLARRRCPSAPRARPTRTHRARRRARRPRPSIGPSRPTLRVRGLSGTYGTSNDADAVLAESLAIRSRAFDELCGGQRRASLLGTPAQRRQLGQHG